MPDAYGYRPDPRLYQQLVPWTPTGRYDCTAASAAWSADFSTVGRLRFSPRQVRLATNEPIPDPASPGLNLPQVDLAIVKLSSGVLNPDTRLNYNVMQAEQKIKAGAMAVVQVDRGVLVDRVDGMDAHSFRGGHAIGVYANAIASPIIFDSLIPRYVTGATWLDIWMAGAKLIGHTGYSNVQFGLDVTRTYRLRFLGGGFYAYRYERGVITARRAYWAPEGAVRNCSRPYLRSGTVKLPSGEIVAVRRTIVKVPDTQAFAAGYEWIAVPQPNVRLEEVL